ncbi:MAG: IclR family transcriptional regulator [Hyphomicrobiales bacterium]|nr:IclR family transcriptional regulator [Hyphomicrobiales bacterium]
MGRDSAIGRDAKETTAPPRARAVAPEQRNLVNSVIKGLRVLEAFSAERPDMTLSEVAQVAGLDPGTTYRLLNTLTVHGYVERIAETKQFRLTLKVLDLGFRAIGRQSIPELARPVLHSLVSEVHEAASLGTLEGSDILYVERVRAGHDRLGVEIRVGSTIPAHCSAIGQALLAYLPERQLEQVLTHPSRSEDMAPVPVSSEELKQALEQIRTDGYCLRDSYFANGLRVLAVPVLDDDNRPLAAISITGLARRTSSEEFRDRALGPALVAARDMSQALKVKGGVSYPNQL